MAYCLQLAREVLVEVDSLEASELAAFGFGVHRVQVLALKGSVHFPLLRVQEVVLSIHARSPQSPEIHTHTHNLVIIIVVLRSHLLHRRRIHRVGYGWHALAQDEIGAVPVLWHG